MRRYRWTCDRIPDRVLPREERADITRSLAKCLKCGYHGALVLFMRVRCRNPWCVDFDKDWLGEGT